MQALNVRTFLSPFLSPTFLHLYLFDQYIYLVRFSTPFQSGHFCVKPIENIQ
jgi:hypothetical protein